MRRIITSAFLVFFTLFSSHSSLWAQAPALASGWVSEDNPRVSFDFGTKSLILPYHTSGSFRINVTANTTAGVANPSRGTYDRSFLNRTRSIGGPNLAAQVLEYGVHRETDPRTTEIVFNIFPKDGSAHFPTTIAVAQFGRTSLVASATISGSDSPTINLVEREIRLPNKAGTFTLTLVPGAEVSAIALSGNTGFLTNTNEVVSLPRIIRIR